MNVFLLVAVLLIHRVPGEGTNASARHLEAQEAAEAAGAPATETPAADLIEDLRLLQILNAASITREQARRLEPLAAEARATLDRLAGEERAALDRLGMPVATARQRLLQRALVDDPVFEQIRQAAEANEERRRQGTETLVSALVRRLQSLLSGVQVERIRETMSAMAGDTWPPGSLRRLYRSAAKEEEDLQRVALDLEKLRAAAGTPEAEAQLQRFLRSLVRDAEPESREHQARLVGARALAQQVLSLPPAGFERRRLELAAAADRLLQSAMETDRLKRAFGAASEPYRWFATQVLLSPRARVVFREKGGATAP